MNTARLTSTVRFVARTYRTLHDMKVRRITPYQAGENLARDASSMGPLYTKLAQFISARQDTLDPDFIKALSAVQDQVTTTHERRVPSVPGYTIDPHPIASASIADVYKGRCDSTGREVAVKVRREGVKEAVGEDLPLLTGVMRAASYVGVPGALNMYELIDQSRDMVVRELDFRLEAGASASFASKLAEVPWLVVPRVVYVTESVMVAEFEGSRKVSAVASPNPALAKRLMDLYMLMLGAGYVHADPHPGNVGFRGDGTVVLYDFGAMLEVQPGIQHHVASVISAGLTKNADEFLKALESLGVLTLASDGHRGRVRRALRRVLNSPNVHDELRGMPEFASNQQGQRMVTFGTTFIYLVRTLTLIDGLCRTLDPDFDYEYSRWVDSPDPIDMVMGVARDAAALPSTLNAMHSDLDEFQNRILDEMHTFRTCMAACVALGIFYFLHGG